VRNWFVGSKTLKSKPQTPARDSEARAAQPAGSEKPEKQVPDPGKRLRSQGGIACGV